MRPDAATDGAGMASLLLADSRLPVGGYTASGGLEPALLGGLPVHEVPAFIAMRLATVARVEAGTAVVASAAVRHLRAGAPGCTCTQGGDVATAEPVPVPEPAFASEDVAWAWAARNPVAAVRDSSIAQGRAMLRLVHRLRPDGPAAQWLEGLPRPLTARAVVLGAFAGELGLDGASVARVVGYDDVQSVTAAALKLEPLDPVDAVAWTLDSASHLDDLVAACADLVAPYDIPVHSAPQLEAWHAAHADTERKLFRV